MLQSLSVLGVPVHLSEDYLGWLVGRIKRRQGVHVVTLNAEMTMQADRDPQLASVIESADLVIPDGSGIVLYLMLQGRTIERCPGIEFSEALLTQLAQEQLGQVFFFGAAPGTAQAAANALAQKIPGLPIAGIQHGFLTPEDAIAFQQQLRDMQPAVILVGLGVPRQEFWIAEHRHLCPNAIWIGVGGSFDVWAGTKERAPEWLRTHNLEWTYRLYQEPWRWKRMLALPQFAWRAVLERVRAIAPVNG